jgi:hypothetical protein
MTKWRSALGLYAVLASGAAIPSALAQQQQIQIIQDTAAAICNTVKEAKGKKSEVQIQGEVKAELGGLVGKVVGVDVGGSGSLSREEFEGLSREATASALEGDRGCRERVFDKMFDKLNLPSNKQSALPKAEKLIAAIDLGYNLQRLFFWIEIQCSAPTRKFGLYECSALASGPNEIEKINGDTKWLHIAPYKFDEAVIMLNVEHFLIFDKKVILFLTKKVMCSAQTPLRSTT